MCEPTKPRVQPSAAQARAHCDVGPCCRRLRWRRAFKYLYLLPAALAVGRCTTRVYSSPSVSSDCCRSAQRPRPGVAARGSFAARQRRRVACAMSDAAPAKAQKTERSGTPHRGRFDQKAKGHNKRGHQNKVGCAERTADGGSPPLLPCLALRSLRAPRASSCAGQPKQRRVGTP